MTSPNPALTLFPLSSTEPIQWQFDPSAFTFCYFFSDLQSESIPRLRKLAKAQLINSASLRKTAFIAVYTGKESPAGRFLWEDKCSAFVFWAGEAGLASDACVRFSVSDTPTMIVLRGSEVVKRRTSLPADLRALLPVKETFESLRKKLEDDQAEVVTAVYDRVREAAGRVDVTGVREMLEQMSREGDLDVRDAVDWFKTPRYKNDPEDFIDTDDVTLPQFCTRFKNYCIWMSSLPGSTVLPLQSIFGGLNSASAYLTHILSLGQQCESLKLSLKSADTQISELKKSVEDRDERIDQLLRDLAQRTAELTNLKRLTAPTPVNSGRPVVAAPVAPVSPLVLRKKEEEKTEGDDEHRFWNYAREDDWEPLRINPHKFEEIASNKGLWLMTAESTGMIDHPDIGMKLFTSKKAATPRTNVLPSVRGSTKQSDESKIKTPFVDMSRNPTGILKKTGSLQTIRQTGRLIVGKSMMSNG